MIKLLTAILTVLTAAGVFAETLLPVLTPGKLPDAPWGLAPSDTALINAGKVGVDAKGVLFSKDANLLLTAAAAQATGEYRAEIAFQQVWPSTVAWVAGQRDVSAHTYYFVEIIPDSKTARFGLARNGKAEVAGTIAYPTNFNAANIRLALVFAGGKVRGELNGVTVGEAVADPAVNGNRVGIRGGYYTQIKPLAVTVEPVAELASSAPAAGLLNYVFAAGNPANDWTFGESTLTQLGTKVKLQKTDGAITLDTLDANAMMTIGDAGWRNYRVTLDGERINSCSVSLLGRVNHLSYYQLKVEPKAVTLSLVLNGKAELLKSAEYPAGYDGKATRLALVFDHGKVTAELNGNIIFEVPDDGRLPAGSVGILGQYWTKFKLKTLTVTEPSAAPAAPAAAVRPEVRPVTALPPKIETANTLVKPDWDLSRAWRAASGTRQRISLNELWQFAPVGNGEAPPAKRGFFIVPGHWRGGNISNFMRDNEGNKITEWNQKKVTDYRAAWYWRTFELPEELRKNSVIELYFENIKGRPAVAVNGQAAGSSPATDNNLRLDITKALKNGDNELAVLVEDDTPNGGQALRAGLFGNVWLEIKPEQHLGSPKLRTLVDDKKMEFTFCSPSAAAGEIVLEICDVDGKVLCKQNYEFHPDQKYELDWLPERLWSPDTPVLYDAVFTLKQNGRVTDKVSCRFGFREFKLADGQFILNGRPVMLRFDTQVPTYWAPDWYFNPTGFRNYLRALKSINIDGIYMAMDAPDELYDLADSEGILVIAKGLVMPHAKLNGADEKWWQNFDADVRQHVQNPVRDNHPSVIGYLVDVWYNYTSGAQNPEYAGLRAGSFARTAISPDGDFEVKTYEDPNMTGVGLQRKNTLDRMIGIYRKYAPDQEFFCGASAHAGNLYSTHLYHTWGAPWSEMRAFFERWSADRELPVFAGEICIPYIGSFYEIDQWSGGGKPYFFENAARISGPSAYRYDPVTTRRPFHDTGAAGIYSQLKVPYRDGYPPLTYPAEAYNDLLAAGTADLLLPWRTANFTGFGAFCVDFALTGYQNNVERLKWPDKLSTPGYKPEQFDPWNAVTRPVLSFQNETDPGKFTVSALPLKRALARVAVWIAGANDFYNQDHAYYAGEKIAKQTVILNDTGKSLSGTVKLRLLDHDGRTAAQKEITGIVADKEVNFVPFEFAAPMTDVRREYRLEAVFEGETAMFDIEVFPKSPVPQLTCRLVVFDPEGTVAGYLTGRNIKFESVSQLSDVKNDQETGTLLLIGRRALSLKASEFDPAKYNGQKIDVLVMEQMSGVSPELQKVRQREAFIYDKAHPVLSGLFDRDFARWRGNAGLLPGYGHSIAGQNWSDWGNRNNLVTFTWRRPYAGNIKTLLAGGFDLGQSPLLEGVNANGRWLSSQLEITERLGKDPVATLLFERFLTYLGSPSVDEGKTAYLGDTPGQLELDADKVTDLAPETLQKYRTVVISGPDFNMLEHFRNPLAEFVYSGGNVIYLQKGGEFSGAWLPFALGLKSDAVGQALIDDPAWARGWSNPELNWGTSYPVPVWHNFSRHNLSTDPAVVMQRPFGQGTYRFLSITPKLFGNDAAAAKTERLRSALLLDAGARFRHSDNPFVRASAPHEFDLSELKWDFITDPENQGLAKNYHRNYDPTGWLHGLVADGLEVRLGMPFESFLGKNYDGVVWYRINVEIPQTLLNQPDIYCCVGAIDDFDEIYINGEKIGETTKATAKWWEAPRIYPVPAGLLRPGKNLIAVRVTDDKGLGGIVKGPFLLTNTPPRSNRLWSNANAAAVERDYRYPADMVRMY